MELIEVLQIIGALGAAGDALLKLVNDLRKTNRTELSPPEVDQVRTTLANIGKSLPGSFDPVGFLKQAEPGG